MDTRSASQLHPRLPYPYSITGNSIVFSLEDRQENAKVARQFVALVNRNKALHDLITVDFRQAEEILLLFTLEFKNKDSINNDDIRQLQTLLSKLGQHQTYNYHVAFDTKDNIIESGNTVEIHMPSNANYTISKFDRWLMEGVIKNRTNPLNINVRLEKSAVRTDVTTLIFNNEAERIEGWKMIRNAAENSAAIRKSRNTQPKNKRSRKKPKLSPDDVIVYLQNTENSASATLTPTPLTTVGTEAPNSPTFDAILREISLSTTTTTTSPDNQSPSSLRGFSLFPTPITNKRKRESESDNNLKQLEHTLFKPS